MQLRPDYRAAVLMKNRLHHESGEPIEELLHPGSTKTNTTRTRSFSPKITSPALELTDIQDGIIGLHLQVPRGGTHLNGVGSELTIFLFCSDLFFCYSWFRLQSMAIHCNRRRVWTEPLATRLSRTYAHFHPCAHITLWLKVSHDVSA